MACFELPGKSLRNCPTIADSLPLPNTTSLTLLDKLRLSSSGEAWQAFVDIYTPLITKWNRGAGLSNADAEDVAQEILLTVYSQLTNFNRKESGSFRKWLYVIARNRIRQMVSRNKGTILSEGIPVDGLVDSGEDFHYAESYYQEVLEGALKYVYKEFKTTSWEAFLDYILLQRPLKEVAKELGVSPNSIYVSRHRIMARVAEVVEEFIEDDDLPELQVGMVEKITTLAAQSLKGRLALK